MRSVLQRWMVKRHALLALVYRQIHHELEHVDRLIFCAVALLVLRFA